MNLYAKAAVKAVEIYQSENVSLEKAWKQAVGHYTQSRHSINKGCPKATFLGLCEEGIVNGIPKGKYTHSKSNKQYALEAVELIRQMGFIHSEILWEMVTNTCGKKHNAQMDVVYALVSSNYISI